MASANLGLVCSIYPDWGHPYFSYRPLLTGAPVRLGVKAHRGSEIVMPEQQR